MLERRQGRRQPGRIGECFYGKAGPLVMPVKYCPWIIGAVGEMMREWL